MVLGRLLVVSALAAACSAAYPSPGTAEVGAVRARLDPHARLADLQHGHDLYLGKCGGCHMVIEPARYTADVWPEKVERMQGEKRVHLAPEEYRDIVRYLVGASAVASR